MVWWISLKRRRIQSLFQWWFTTNCYHFASLVSHGYVKIVPWPLLYYRRRRRREKKSLPSLRHPSPQLLTRVVDLSSVFFVEYFWIREMSSGQMQWCAAILGRSIAGPPALYVRLIQTFWPFRVRDKWLSFKSRFDYLWWFSVSTISLLLYRVRGF